MSRRLVPPGALIALAAAALFGASTPAAKSLLGDGVDPWLLAGLLYLGSGVGLGAFLAVRRLLALPPAEAPLRRADLVWLAPAVLAGGVVGPALMMLGLQHTPASSAALLLNLEGVATLAIAWVVFRESVDHRLLVGAAAILGGAVLLSLRGPGEAVGWGALAIAGACLAWGIDNNLTRTIAASDPVTIAALKGLVAGAVNLGLATAAGAALPPAAVVALAGTIGLLGYGISLVLFVLALRALGTARTGAYFSTAPLIGAVLAVAVLGEPFTVKLAIAAAMMGLGTWLHLAERHDHEHVHEAFEHAHRHVHDAHHQHAHGEHDPPCEPHSHWHRHAPLIHRHPHYPDIHHRHAH